MSLCLEQGEHFSFHGGRSGTKLVSQFPQIQFREEPVLEIMGGIKMEHAELRGSHRKSALDLKNSIQMNEELFRQWCKESRASESQSQRKERNKQYLWAVQRGGALGWCVRQPAPFTELGRVWIWPYCEIGEWRILRWQL